MQFRPLLNTKPIIITENIAITVANSVGNMRSFSEKENFYSLKLTFSLEPLFVLIKYLQLIILFIMNQIFEKTDIAYIHGDSLQLHTVKISPIPTELNSNLYDTIYIYIYTNN